MFVTEKNTALAQEHMGHKFCIKEMGQKQNKTRKWKPVLVLSQAPGLEALPIAHGMWFCPPFRLRKVL